MSSKQQVPSGARYHGVWGVNPPKFPLDGILKMRRRRRDWSNTGSGDSDVFRNNIYQTSPYASFVEYLVPGGRYGHWVVQRMDDTWCWPGFSSMLGMKTIP